MAKFCTKCGAPLDDAAQFCSNCGTAQPAQQTQNAQQNYQQQTQNTQQNTQQTYQQNAQYNYTQQPQGNGFFSAAMRQDDYTAQYHPQDIADNKLMAVLSYIGILVLIPFFAEKNSHYARFHCVQGMYLWLGGLAVNVALGIVMGIFAIIPFAGWILSALLGFVMGVFDLAVLALMILGIVNAATGKAKNLPVIYMLRDRLGWFK